MQRSKDPPGSVEDPVPHYLGPRIRICIWWALGSGSAFFRPMGPNPATIMQGSKDPLGSVEDPDLKSGSAFCGPLDTNPHF